MSPAPASVVRIVGGVRAHLLGRARLALGLWLAAAFAGALALAWLVVAPEGWRQGTSAPLLIDVLVVGMCVSGWLVHRRLAGSWLRERNVANSIEQEVGMAPGVLRGSLELARTLPPGVSSGLADQAAQDALGQLGGEHRDLAGRMTREVGRWMRRGGLGLTVLMPLVAVLTVVAPGRSLMAWAGLARPFELMAGPTLPALVVTPGTVEVLQGAPTSPMEVSAPGRTTVTVHWQAAGDVALRRDDRSGWRPGIVRAPKRHGPNRLLGPGPGWSDVAPLRASASGSALGERPDRASFLPAVHGPLSGGIRRRGAPTR